MKTIETIVRGLPSHVGKFAGWLLLGFIGLSTALADDLNFASIGKGVYYEQLSSEIPMVRPIRPYIFLAEARVQTNAFFADVDLLAPGKHIGTSLFWSDWDEGYFYLNYRTSADRPELDTQCPSGDYVMELEWYPTSEKLFITNTITEGSFPNAPAIANLAAAQSVDAANDFELIWNPFIGGTSRDFISCQLQQVSSNLFNTPFFGSPGALDGTATSVVIPAGTLLPGHAYLGRLVFATTQSLATNQAAGMRGATFYFSQTDFWLKTSGTGDNTPPAIAWTSPTMGATGVPYNTPITVHFTERMGTSNYSYAVTGGGGFGWLRYSPDGAEVVITPSTLQGSPTILFNPKGGGVPRFGDLNGNPLASDTLAVSFTVGTNFFAPSPASLFAPQPQGNGEFQIGLRGEPSYSYVLQQSTNLAKLWSPVATNVAFSGTALFPVTNTAPPGLPLLYRAVYSFTKW